jgi:GNAT superfamily N-acetyltransferase
MSPHRQLLLACCRAHLPHSSLDRSVNRQVDWIQLLKVAQRLGVAALVRANLQRCVDHARIPPDVVARFDRVYYEQAIQNARLGASLAEVLAAFSRSHIPIIVLKGASLSELVYGNIALRPMKDVDVLVRSRDLDHADGLLQELGYVPDEWYRPAAWYRRHHHHLAPYRSRDGASILELHHHIFPPASGVRISMEDLWLRARPAALSSGPAMVLAPGDLLLHLCVGLSAVEHFREGLRTLCDIAATLKRYQTELDWVCVLEAARMYSLEKHLYYSLWLTGSLVSADVPVHVWEALKRSMRRQGVGAPAMKWLIRRAVFRYEGDGSAVPIELVPAVLAELLAVKSGSAKMRGFLRLALRGFKGLQGRLGFGRSSLDRSTPPQS